MAAVTLKSGVTIQVDDEYLPLLEEWTFALVETSPGHCYVRRAARGDKQEVFLHRIVMNATPDQIVDHWNGDTLDNRRENLRLVDWYGNARNQSKKRRNNGGVSCTSRFKGVSIDARVNKWQVKIRCADGVRRSVGNFHNEVEAAFAYDVASLREHGEFGRRNFLPLVV